MPARLLRGLVLAVVVASAGSGTAFSAGTIVRGTAIQIQSAPWAVFVTYQSGATPNRCSGSVLDASHVLTAAHCLYAAVLGPPARPGDLSVVAGVTSTLTPSATDAEQDRGVTAFRVHPGFANDGQDVPDDVAVLTLAQPLDLSGTAVRAIALPAEGRYPGGATAILASFGRPSPTGAPGVLASLSAVVEPQGACGEFTDSWLIQAGNATMLCALSRTSGTCGADSGGGLVLPDASPQLVAIEVGSSADCRVGADSVFVNLAAPEILRFVLGDDQPPAAPRPSKPGTFYRLTWDKPLAVGGTVWCSTGGWPDGMQVGYAFLSAGGDVLQSGSRSTYVVAPAAAGTRIRCQVAVTGAGGTTLETTGASPAVATSVAIEPIAPVSVRRGRSAILRIVLRSAPGATGLFASCARIPIAVAEHGGQCSSARMQAGPKGLVPLTLTFRVGAAAPLGTARIGIVAQALGSTATATALVHITDA